jgi:hypothetical protein
MVFCNWVMVAPRHKGKTFLTVRGPETQATTAECPADGEWIGIHFKLGTFMTSMPNGHLRDRNDVTLSGASGRSFWLNGSAWEYPTFENAETFVDRLVRQGLIAIDPCVGATLNGWQQTLSQRTEQRHFLRATGMTHATVRQIERARHSTRLLRSGTSIQEVVHEAGYFDQAHLTRSLNHFIGQTPAHVARGEGQLSLLYNTGNA